MFKVGQEVFSATHGKGVVTIAVDAIMFYPVEVKFDSGIVEAYTLDGKLFVYASNPDLVAIP